MVNIAVRRNQKEDEISLIIQKGLEKERTAQYELEKKYIDKDVVAT